MKLFSLIEFPYIKINSRTLMQVPGFEPGLKAWKAFVLPGYTTPAYLGGCIENLYIKFSSVSLIFPIRELTKAKILK